MSSEADIARGDPRLDFLDPSFDPYIALNYIDLVSPPLNNKESLSDLKEFSSRLPQSHPSYGTPTHGIVGSSAHKFTIKLREKQNELEAAGLHDISAAIPSLFGSANPSRTSEFEQAKKTIVEFLQTAPQSPWQNSPYDPFVWLPLSSPRPIIKYHLSTIRSIAFSHCHDILSWDALQPHAVQAMIDHLVGIGAENFLRMYFLTSHGLSSSWNKHPLPSDLCGSFHGLSSSIDNIKDIYSINDVMYILYMVYHSRYCVLHLQFYQQHTQHHNNTKQNGPSLPFTKSFPARQLCTCPVIHMPPHLSSLYSVSPGSAAPPSQTANRTTTSTPSSTVSDPQVNYIRSRLRDYSIDLSSIPFRSITWPLHQTRYHGIRAIQALPGPSLFLNHSIRHSLESTLPLPTVRLTLLGDRPKDLVPTPLPLILSSPYFIPFLTPTFDPECDHLPTSLGFDCSLSDHSNLDQSSSSSSLPIDEYLYALTDQLRSVFSLPIASLQAQSSTISKTLGGYSEDMESFTDQAKDMFSMLVGAPSSSSASPPQIQDGHKLYNSIYGQLTKGQQSISSIFHSMTFINKSGINLSNRSQTRLYPGRKSHGIASFVTGRLELYDKDGNAVITNASQISWSFIPFERLYDEACVPPITLSDDIRLIDHKSNNKTDNNKQNSRKRSKNNKNNTSSQGLWILSHKTSPRMIIPAQSISTISLKSNKAP